MARKLILVHGNFTKCSCVGADILTYKSASKNLHILEAMMGGSRLEISTLPEERQLGRHEIDGVFNCFQG